MKHARKLTSLLLALVMVFALAVTVGAEGTGSITVDNPIEGQNYTAYKIFDVVYEVPTTTEHYSYTIKDGDGGSPWYGTVSAYATTEANGLTLTQVEGTNTYVVTFDKDKFSAPKFAETLKNALSTVNPTSDVHQFTANAEGKQVADSLPLGYYFVTSTNGTLCNLTTTDPEVTIHDKNDMHFEKTAPENSVEVGQTVHYTITGKVPDYTGFDTYTYEITDKMSDGLTFDEGSVCVKVGGTEQTASDDTYTFAKGNESDNYTFKVTIYVKNYAVGQPIEVTYTATVNEKAVAQVSQNAAVLKYSNKPGTDETGEIKPTPHKVYSAKITINKYWTDKGEKKALENVGFKLYKKVPAEAGGAETIQYYVKNESTDAVTWDTDIKKATEVKTSATGVANFTGLANGDYWLVESTTPAGYNPLEKPVDVKVEGNADNLTTLTVTKEIENKTGAVLPSTGGMGTTIFYVLGAVLVVGAGVLLVTKKRMSQSEI